MRYIAAWIWLVVALVTLLIFPLLVPFPLVIAVVCFIKANKEKTDDRG